jgi:hypothetical protein
VAMGRAASPQHEVAQALCATPREVTQHCVDLPLQKADTPHPFHKVATASGTADRTSFPVLLVDRCFYLLF